MPRPPAKHGTRSKYNAGCRCDPCRKDASDYHAKARQARSQRPLPEGVKHDYSTYTNYGCRCDACRKDASEYLRQWNRKRKEETQQLKAEVERLRRIVESAP